MFPIWLLEADLPSTHRNGSHVMEYKQTQPGALIPTVTQSSQAEEDGCFKQSKGNHRLLLGLLNVTKLSFLKMRFPLPAGPEMVQVIKSNSLGGGVLSCSSLKASDSRKQEGCVTRKKNVLKGSAETTDSAHSWPRGGALPTFCRK